MAGTNAAGAGAVIPPYCNPAELGYHLRADIKHDFKGLASGLTYAPPERPATNYDEAAVVKYFLEGAGRGVIENFDLRSSQTNTFAAPEKTNTFQSWTPPVLYTTGNEAVGIVQDAGHYITDILKAKNVLTFGSVLDPAPKPAGPERSPIWFKPSVDAVRIPLDMFGFAPASIQALEVSGFNGGIAVCANYVIGDVRMDAIALGSSQARPGVKPISRVDIRDAGFFTSIAKAENLPTELTASGVFPNETAARIFVAAHSEKFFIGKTLGDVTLVASAMQTFCDGTPNPYTGIGGTSGTWNDINNNPLDASTVAPSILMLKTGDRLNWIRAIIMGVGAIYEDQPTNIRKSLQYKFFPATLSNEEMKTAILGQGFAAIRQDVQRRYDGLETSLNALIDTGGGADGAVLETINNRAIFVGEMQPVLTRQPGITIGARVVRDIQRNLVFLRDTVLAWVDRRLAAVPAPIDELKKWYEDTRVRANACTPTASSIFVEKAAGIVIPMKVIVSNVSTTAINADPDWPLTVSIDISMRMAFGRLNNATDRTGGLVGTDLKKRFFDKIDSLRAAAAPEGGQRGGAGDGILDYNETISPILNDSRPLPSLVGQYTIVFKPLFIDPDEARNLLRDCPHIQSFAKYLTNHVGRTAQQVYEAIDNITIWRSSRACIDDIAAADIAEEWNMLQERGHITVTARPDRESRDTMLFNAFVCCVNARNCRGFGSLQYEDTVSERDFIFLESKFITAYYRRPTAETSAIKRSTGEKQRMKTAKKSSSVYETVTPNYSSATSSSSLPVAAGAPQSWSNAGGLRNRRSLYTKPQDAGGSAAAHRRWLYAGLRERTGPRTTARVRQRAGKSHTRRQRKHLDRI